MAYRRPFQNLTQISIEDSSDDDEPAQVMKFIEPSRPKISTNKVHPASTNFSLDTFSAFLQNELKQKRLRKERLRSNPALATVEAEKEQLSRLVNSNRSIEARIRNGRLEVRGAVKGRSLSPPVSEGDNESCSGVGRHSPGSGSSKGNSTGRTKIWGPRKRKLVPVDSQNQNGTEPVEEQDFDMMWWYDDLDSSSSQSLQPSASRFEQYQSSMSQVSGCGTASASVPNQSNRTESQILKREARRRSLSFERHAEEVRNSARPSKESSRQIPPKQEDAASSSLNQNSLRLRKAVPNSSDSGLLSAVPNPTVSSPSASNCFDDFVGAESSNLFPGREIVSDDEWMSVDPAFITSTIETRSQNTNTKKPGHQLPAHVSKTSTVSKTKRRPLTGKDTFFTASSDSPNDTSSDGEDPERKMSELESAAALKPKTSQITRLNSNRHDFSNFNYHEIIPEVLPGDMRQARENCNKIWSLLGLTNEGLPDPAKPSSWFSTQYSVEELDPSSHNILGTSDPSGVYPRRWNAVHPPIGPKDPPHCFPLFRKEGFPEQMLPLVCQYLSSQEVRNLRLVNRVTASAVLPLMIRSTVIRFGTSLFCGTDGSDWNRKSNAPAFNSLTQSYGQSMNKFGISFDFDQVGLASAETKVIEEEVDAWFGKYVWPKATYPRFQQLKEMEDLVDGNRPLLKNTMKTLSNVSELAISVDSGHGWLNGPDISDLALFRQRQQGGSKVFGKTFNAPDRWNDFALRQYFKMGQLNTLNVYKKHLASTRDAATFTKLESKVLRRFQVREYDEYKVQSEQPDFNRGAHVGLTMSSLPHQNGAQGMAALVGLTAAPTVFASTLLQAQAAPTQWAAAIHQQMPANINQPNAFGNAIPPAFAGGPPRVSTLFPPLPALSSTLTLIRPPPCRPCRPRQFRRLARGSEPQAKPILPQWPILFSGYNLTAQMGGNQDVVQDEVSSPATFAYLPGVLTEAQVQWLMETLWAQRAFLSAYTHSVISNAGTFKNVHSLHVAKLSSGLISSLAQGEFWSSLPNLKNLTLKIIPDWRQEHVPGDKFYHRNMPISPVQASVKLAYLLENFVANIESLSALRVGFVGGGEHQTGMFGRNRHVLPAPVTHWPLDWLTDHETKPDPRTMFVFNHIRDLTFENCWFSPCMLESFMLKSQDTSLHHLVLDSVSMTGVHDTRHDRPLSTEGHNLRCEFSPGEWLQESIPRSACWVNALENITPGRTILERKYDARMIDEEVTPQPKPKFRGNIKKITLKSCGYVLITGVRAECFYQNGVVDQGNPWSSLDPGLEVRRKMFYVNNHHESPVDQYDFTHPRALFLRRNAEDEIKEVPRYCIMMSNKDPEGRNEYFGLGKLTQCVHPVEKRVLERAWGLRFGWGDDMERWAAVEDGWFEGGTGRFSGTIERDDND